jgi:hypothetical protein
MCFRWTCCGANCQPSRRRTGEGATHNAAIIVAHSFGHIFITKKARASYGPKKHTPACTSGHVKFRKLLQKPGLGAFNGPGLAITKAVLLQNTRQPRAGKARLLVRAFESARF